jgi:hypothetical protein
MKKYFLEYDTPFYKEIVSFEDKILRIRASEEAEQEREIIEIAFSFVTSNKNKNQGDLMVSLGLYIQDRFFDIWACSALTAKAAVILIHQIHSKGFPALEGIPYQKDAVFDLQEMNKWAEYCSLFEKK